MFAQPHMLFPDLPMLHFGGVNRPSSSAHKRQPSTVRLASRLYRRNQTLREPALKPRRPSTGIATCATGPGAWVCARHNRSEELGAAAGRYLMLAQVPCATKRQLVHASRHAQQFEQGTAPFLDQLLSSPQGQTASRVLQSRPRRSIHCSNKSCTARSSLRMHP